MNKLKVGILGTTGAAGIEFLKALDNHPWFEVKELYASKKNEGKTFEEGCKFDVSGFPIRLKNKTLKSLEKINLDLDMICSALPSEIARFKEKECAKTVPVISTTSAFRYEEDVPILITEVNLVDHYKLLEKQKQKGWKGWVAPGPNCTTVGLAMSLQPIHYELGIERVIMSSYQSISGGGTKLIQKWREDRFGGTIDSIEVEEPFSNPILRLADNVIGYIDKEEQKVKNETLKILGNYDNGLIENAQFAIDCSCVRVPTLRGHFETVFVETLKSCSEKELKDLYFQFNEFNRLAFGNLPSSPKKSVVVLERSPQPFYDSYVYGGMAVIIGRIEKNDAFANGFKYQVLSNNTEKGAAKGMVQVAEYLYSIGFLKKQ